MLDTGFILGIVFLLFGIGYSLYVRYMQKNGIQVTATVVNAELEKGVKYYGVRSISVIPILSYTAYGKVYTKRCPSIHYSNTAQIGSQVIYDDEFFRGTWEHLGEQVEILVLPNHPTTFIIKNAPKRFVIIRILILIGAVATVATIIEYYLF